jgi:hypothetical protein
LAVVVVGPFAALLANRLGPHGGHTATESNRLQSRGWCCHAVATNRVRSRPHERGRRRSSLTVATVWQRAPTPPAVSPSADTGQLRSLDSQGTDGEAISYFVANGPYRRTDDGIGLPVSAVAARDLDGERLSSPVSLPTMLAHFGRQRGEGPRVMHDGPRVQRSYQTGARAFNRRLREPLCRAAAKI